MRGKKGYTFKLSLTYSVFVSNLSYFVNILKQVQYEYT